MSNTQTRAATLLATFLIFASGWLAVPYASQDANDGFILFTSDAANPSDVGICGNCEDIYVMDADGTDLRQLTDAPGSDANPSFSPKGDRIAFESNRDGRPEIYVVNTDGSGLMRLTDFSGQPTPTNASVSKPTWSPKADRIAFHRRVGATGTRGHFEVYTIDLESGLATQITFTPSPGFSGFPSWAKWSARSF